MSEVPLYYDFFEQVNICELFAGARPVHLIITMIKWIWTSRLSIKNSLSAGCSQVLATSPGNVDALCGYACFKSTVIPCHVQPL